MLVCCCVKVLTVAFVCVSQEDLQKQGSSERIVHSEQRHGARTQGEDTKWESGAHGDLLYAFYFYFTVNKDTFSSQESCILGLTFPHPHGLPPQIVTETLKDLFKHNEQDKKFLLEFTFQ